MLLQQIETANTIDSEELTLHDAHTVPSLGSVGQNRSFSQRQFFVSIVKNAGEELMG
jgi:hypothetical protein